MTYLALTVPLYGHSEKLHYITAYGEKLFMVNFKTIAIYEILFKISCCTYVYFKNLL